MSTVGSAKVARKPPHPRERMPNQIVATNTISASAASVSRCAVGGSMPGTSDDQLAVKMNRNSVPISGR